MSWANVTPLTGGTMRQNAQWWHKVRVQRGVMMSSKTLRTIQTIVKVAKIVCNVVFVCSLVGAILCLVGIVCAGFPNSLKIGGVTVHSIVGNGSEVSKGALYGNMAAGAIMCVVSCVVSKLAVRYCAHELDDGTPFTLQGARELFRLGICTICVPLGGIVAASICNAIIGNCFGGVCEPSVSGNGFVSAGAVMLFVSLICKDGAELFAIAAEDERQRHVQTTIGSK